MTLCLRPILVSPPHEMPIRRPSCLAVRLSLDHLQCGQRAPRDPATPAFCTLRTAGLHLASPPHSRTHPKGPSHHARDGKESQFPADPSPRLIFTRQRRQPLRCEHGCESVPFRDKRELERHLIAKHGHDGPTWHCGGCGKYSCTRNDNFNRHIKEKCAENRGHDYVCGHCNFRDKSKSVYLDHWELTHGKTHGKKT